MSSLNAKSLFYLIFLTFFFQCAKPEKDEVLIAKAIEPQKIKLDPVLENRKAQLLHETGFAQQDSGLYEKAIASYNRSKMIREAVLNQQTAFKDTLIRDSILQGIIKSLHNIGFCYYSTKQFEKAADATKYNIELQRHFKKEWDFERVYRKAWSYHLLGQIISEHEGFEEALFYYRNAKNYFLIDDDTWGVADIHNDLSDLFLDWRIPDSVIIHSKKAIELYSNLELKQEMASSFLNLSIGLFEKENYDSALKELNSAYDLYINKRTDNLVPIAKIHHNRALVLQRKGSLAEALNSIDSSIWIVENELNTSYHSSLLAHSISIKADILFQQEQYANALKYYNSSITKFLDKHINHDITNLDFFSKDIIITNKIDFLEAFAGRAQTLAALGEEIESLQTYDKSIQLIHHVRRNYRDAQSKIRLAEITKRIFEGAIKVSLQTDNQEKALAYAEQSKGFTLMESLKHNQAVEQVINDETALELERELRKNIREIEQEYSLENEPIAKAQLLEKRQVYQNNLDNLLDKLNENQAYQQLMAEFSVLSSKEIQHTLLKEDQALVEYFIGDKNSYAFFIPKSGDIEVVELQKGRSTINQEVKKLIYAIYPEENKVQEAGDTLLRTFNKAADSVYAEQAYALYQDLLKPVIESKVDQFQRLIIVPDDVLGYLPFDALLTTDTIAPGQYKDFDYLGRSYPISYCYSAALLKEMQSHDKKRAVKNKMLAFAHSQGAFQSQLSQIKGLFNAFNGRGPGFVKALTNHPNPKAFLEENAGLYRILHYSTHGEVNDREPNYSYLRMLPYPSTNPDSIYQLFEIFNTPIRAELVVTSACNTGIGKLFRGEGIMSLARGFSYAGASSIVTTLWAVQTEDSEILLHHFYKNLQAQQNKDVALFQAKKNFFESDGKAQQAYHPVYWAGFIPVGDMASMDLPTNPSPVGILLKAGLLIGLVLVLVLWFRKKNANAKGEAHFSSST